MGGLDPQRTHPLGSTEVRVTRVGFGGAPLGNLFRSVTEADATATLDAAWTLGLRYFDTAPLYGHGLGERRLGRFLATKPRSEFSISTKVGRVLVPVADGRTSGGAYVDVPPVEPVYDYSRDGARKSLDASLKRLGLDRVDVLYIHDIDRFTHGDEQPRRFREAMDGAYPAIAELKRSGVVGAIGLGVNEWQVCEAAVRAGDFDAFLLAGRYSLLEQEALVRLLSLCVERSVSVVIGGPFNSGILATGPVPGAVYNYAPASQEILDRVERIQSICRAHRVPLPAAALQFPLHHPAVASVIPGPRTAAEATRNLELLRHPIPAALWSDLKAAGLLRADAPTVET
jgi:D-threo-aldose 1-dehydrogenase